MNLREYYREYSDRIDHILRKPTEEELAGLMPAFHKLKRPDGSDATIGDYERFAKDAWRAKQKREIIDLIAEAKGDKDE